MRLPRPARTALTALVALLWLPIGAPTIAAQDTPAIFKSSIAVVPITAIVRDSRNRVVRNLARDDFQVLENSQLRTIVDFHATDNAPLTVAVLLDTSGSMRGAHLDEGRETVRQLLDALNPASDQLALFTFDKRLRQETPFTSEAHRVRTALNHTDAWGLTSLYDAIADTAKRLARRPAPRRAVVVITDGLDTSSQLSSAQVSGMASSIDVPVYILVLAPQRNSQPGASEEDLSSLAYWTGGDVRRVTSPGDTARTVAALVSELHQQYFLAIESADASGWYRLDVKTKRSGLTVRSRTGYFASAGRTELNPQ